MDIEAFQTCMESGSVKADIQKDADDASAMSIAATPTVVVAKTSKQGLEGEVLVGVQPLVVFDATIKRVLGGTAAEPASSAHS